MNKTAKNRTSGRISKTFLFLFSAALFLTASAIPAACADVDLDQILEADSYFILRNNEDKKMQEGYKVLLKGFGSDTVLLEIHNTDVNPTLVGEVVLSEGETVQCYRTYRENTSIVLMLTLDKMYLNNSQIIAGFSHVYQYKDPYSGRYPTEWALATAFLEDPSTPTSPNPSDPPKNDSNTDIGKDLIENPMNIIAAITLIAALVIVAMIFKKRK